MHINSLKQYYARPVLNTIGIKKEEEPNDDVDVLETKLIKECKLRNSDVLANINAKFQHLTEYRCEDLRSLLSLSSAMQ